jgi:hypothetical protein
VSGLARNEDTLGDAVWDLYLSWVAETPNTSVLSALKRCRRSVVALLILLILALIAFAAIFLGLGMSLGRGMLYESPERITETLLEATPRGTPRPVVRRFVDSKGWQTGGRLLPDEKMVDRICVYLGETRSVLGDERVYAEWRFDAADKLIDVYVYKAVLSL